MQLILMIVLLVNTVDYGRFTCFPVWIFTAVFHTTKTISIGIEIEWTGI